MSTTSNLAKAYQTHKRKVWAAGAVVALFGLESAGYPTISRLYRTPGVANIERRYTSGGATPTHTPGAATRRGDVDNVSAREAKDQGVGTERFKEKVGDQRPDPNVFDKATNKVHYGQEKGK